MVGDRIASSLLTVAYYAALFPLFQIAIFRMRRYRLTRTVWRGVRAGQDGATGAYVKRACRLAGEVICSLGARYPHMRVALTGYLMNNTRFGTKRFSFAADPAVLAPYWAPARLFCVLAVLGFGWWTFDGFSLLEAGPWLWGPIAATFALAAIFYARYRAVEFLYFVLRTRLGDTRFATTLAPTRVLRVCLVYFGLYALWTALLMVILIGVLIPVVFFGPSYGTGSSFLDIAIMLGFVFVFSGGYSIIKFGWFRYDLVRLIASGLLIHDLAAIKDVIQDSQAIPGHGEGLADGLDVGDF